MLLLPVQQLWYLSASNDLPRIAWKKIKIDTYLFRLAKRHSRRTMCLQAPAAPVQCLQF